MVKTYIIIADGSATRWREHLGIPKQLIPINGEPIIKRTSDYFKGQNTFVTTHDNRIKDIVDVDVYEPVDNTMEIDKFYSTYPIWSGQTTFVYGDCYFSDNALERISKHETEDFTFFCRPFESKITGKEYGEVFAISVNESFLESFRSILSEVREKTESKEIDRGGAWELYRYMVGIDPNAKTELIGTNQVVIDDETEDFDTPQDYTNYMKALYNNE